MSKEDDDELVEVDAAFLQSKYGSVRLLHRFYVLDCKAYLPHQRYVRWPFLR